MLLYFFGNHRVREILTGIFISFEFEVFVNQIAGGYSQKLEKPNVNVGIFSRYCSPLNDYKASSAGNTGR